MLWVCAHRSVGLIQSAWEPKSAVQMDVALTAQNLNNQVSRLVSSSKSQVKPTLCVLTCYVPAFNEKLTCFILAVLNLGQNTTIN